MLILKNDVRICGLRAELLLGISIANEVYNNFGYDCVITSITDGKHSRGSLHYNGCAVDLRIRHLDPEHIPLIHQMLIDNLGCDFDVVLESNHFHIEYQPKQPY